MNFVEAIEEMKKGNLCRLIQHGDVLPWRYKDGIFQIVDKNNIFSGNFSLNHFEGEWEIYQELKKTLFEKRLNDGTNPRIYLNDVKEALKEYIKKVEARYSQYFNNEKESNYNKKIKEDAYEIFGKEMIEK